MSQSFPKSLMLAAALSGCSTLPSGPSVLVLPGTGKDYALFRTDDAQCKEMARAQIAAAKVPPNSDESAQQAYDIAYIQCMYGKGHRVPVPGSVTYGTRQDWHPPPPPNLPPPQSAPIPQSDR